MRAEVETPLQNLYRKMTVTACARFEAQLRLEKDHYLSLWTVSLVSVGIVGYQLIDILSIQIALSQPTLALIQIISGLTITIIAGLLNVSRFSERAVRMYSCALEINQLIGKIFPDIRDTDQDLYYKM